MGSLCVDLSSVHSIGLWKYLWLNGSVCSKNCLTLSFFLTKIMCFMPICLSFLVTVPPSNSRSSRTSFILKCFLASVISSCIVSALSQPTRTGKAKRVKLTSPITTAIVM